MTPPSVLAKLGIAEDAPCTKDIAIILIEEKGFVRIPSVQSNDWPNAIHLEKPDGEYFYYAHVITNVAIFGHKLWKGFYNVAFTGKSALEFATAISSLGKGESHKI